MYILYLYTLIPKFRKLKTLKNKFIYNSNFYNKEINEIIIRKAYFIC